MRTVELIVVKAHAKINLYLDVTGARDDGYHSVATVLQSVDLSDEIGLVKTDRMELIVSDTTLMTTQNLAWKAAEKLLEVRKPPSGVGIEILKNIPVGAGLGGGSADAAAVLAGLNLFWNLGLSSSELASIAAELGADVPFFLRGGTVFATGVGDVLAPLPHWGGRRVAIAVPGRPISTGWAYGKLDELGLPPLGGGEAARQAFSGGVRAAEYEIMANRFEEVVANDYPEVMELKETALAAGADVALLSGSGAAVFAVTSDADKAEAVAEALRGTGAQVIVTGPSSVGLEWRTEEGNWAPLSN